MFGIYYISICVLLAKVVLKECHVSRLLEILPAYSEELLKKCSKFGSADHISVVLLALLLAIYDSAKKRQHSETIYLLVYV